MDHQARQTGRRSTRPCGAAAGAPMLLALAFMLVASLDLTDGPFAGSARDSGHARAVSRPLTEALARAVRGIVGVQRQRPMTRDRALAGAERGRPAEVAAPSGFAPAARHFVRDGLLNLPPPMLRA